MSITRTSAGLKTRARVCAGHLLHLFIEQRRHGVRHDVILEGARRHYRVTVAQLLS